MELGIYFPLRWRQFLFWWARSVLSIHKIKINLIFIKGSKTLLTEIMKGTFTGLVTEAVIFLKEKKNF